MTPAETGARSGFRGSSGLRGWWGWADLQVAALQSGGLYQLGMMCADCHAARSDDIGSWGDEAWIAVLRRADLASWDELVWLADV